jgi:TolB-like protein
LNRSEATFREIDPHSPLVPTHHGASDGPISGFAVTVHEPLQEMPDMSHASLLDTPRRASLVRTARRSAQRLALLCTAAAVVLTTASEASAQEAPRPTVAVMYFTNSALMGNADYQPLSKGMAELLITELSRNRNIRVVERDRLQELLAEQNLSSGDRVDKETAVRMGKILGAGHMLMGTFVIDPRENMRIDVRAVNTETSEIEYVESIEGKASKLLSMVSELGTKVNGGLKLPARPADAPKFSDAGGKNPNQFRAMLLMSRAIEEQDRKNVPAAVALYKQAIEANPDFERAKVLLASLERGTPER